ncbi:MAG TPA: FlgD immunoglobulin-like domain containing protein [Candidatus Krumholzibacteria bacterium]|nr:FlgD immunoglobulin-like domain containing protein [Candidatus Krumholzibacteria bacterium]
MNRLLMALIGALVLVAACGDDNGPESWQTTVRVTDQEGHRVAGLDLMILMDSPFYQDGLANKAAVTLRWYQPEAARMVMTVEDVARGTIRHVYDQESPAGSHAVVWNGLDDDGVHAYSGLYYAHLVAYGTADSVRFDASAPMFLAMMDFDQATLGTTDADGEIVLRDRTLFPHLYGDPGMIAVDENGDPIGLFPLTSTYRFYLRDPRYGHVERIDLGVTGTMAYINVPWLGVDAPPAPGDVPSRPGPLPTPPVTPELGYVFRGPAPNPFN